MRPLLLFLALLLAFFAILKFYPESDATTVVGGAPPVGEGEAVEDGAYLSRPAGQEVAPTERPEVLSGRMERKQPVALENEAPAAGERGWMDDFDGIARAGREEVELAGAMVHDRCEGLGEAIQSLGEELPDDRGRLIYAFGLAYRGNVREAAKVRDQITGTLGQVEERLLGAMMEGANPPRSPERASAHGPLALAMSMLTTERRVEDYRSEKAWAQAAGGLSELILAEHTAPWESSRKRLLGWGVALNEVQQRNLWNPNGSWASDKIEVESGDSLQSVLSRYRRANPGVRISTGFVALVNGVANGLIHPGDEIRIPTGEVRVEVSLDNRMLFVTLAGEVIAAWECAVGAPGQETTSGDFAAGGFEKNPNHFAKGEPVVYFGDPKNPLGTRWIAWWDNDGTENNLSLGFHGTNKPETVGSAASKGCVRLRNEDVEVLYAILPRMAPIHVE